MGRRCFKRWFLPDTNARTHRGSGLFFCAAAEQVAFLASWARCTNRGAVSAGLCTCGWGGMGAEDARLAAGLQGLELL